jgi:hypothetical protein
MLEGLVNKLAGILVLKLPIFYGDFVWPTFGGRLLVADFW